MKKTFVFLLLPLALSTVAHATTWYIRHDGGTNTQCTGTTNAAYPGSGTGLPCAYNHPYQMMNWSGAWTSFAGGDTMQFADPPTNTTPYYMGEQNAGVGMDWNTQLGAICAHPNAGHSAGASCILPVIPSGTAINHTKIIGQNAGSCHTAGHTGLVNPTILSGIAGAFAVIDVQGSNYVDLACIEITQPDNCTNAGQGSGGGCPDLGNYISVAGIVFEYGVTQGPSNLTMQDISIAGTAGYGILGSHLNKGSADVITGSDIYIVGNGGGGWNADGGGCIASCESLGTLNLSYLDVEGNGCLLLKPFDVSKSLTQNSFSDCFGQNTTGYGDGFVLIAAGNSTVNIDHSKFMYNTQDGLDGLHISDDITTSPTLNVTNSWSEGNGGQAIKIGTGAHSTAINNITISNCHVLADSSAFPNNPPGWTPLDYADTCRAAGNQWAFQMKSGSTLLLENNTIMGYGTTMFDLGCAPLDNACGSNGAAVTEINDLHMGFPDPGNAGRLASGWYFEPGLSPSNVTADHNLWYSMRTGCPDNTLVNETNYVCTDPLMQSESNYDALNPTLLSGSPAIGAGIAISGVTTDFNNFARPNPPSIGALEFGSVITTPSPPPPGTPPPPPSTGALPEPSLNLASTLPLNTSIGFSYPAGYNNVTFVWSIVPAAGGAGSVQASSTLQKASASGGAINAKTSAPGLNLALYGFTPGAYTISVQATDGIHPSSLTASQTVNLVLADLSNVRVYPNPWRKDKHANSPITFDQMTAGCDVKIFTVSGHKVKELNAASGSATWDLTNDSGDKVASGIYLYLIKDSQGNKQRGKLAVIR